MSSVAQVAALLASSCGGGGADGLAVWVSTLICGDGRDGEEEDESMEDAFSLPLPDGACVAASTYVRGVGLGLCVCALHTCGGVGVVRVEVARVMLGSGWTRC